MTSTTCTLLNIVLDGCDTVDISFDSFFFSKSWFFDAAVRERAFIISFEKSHKPKLFVDTKWI